MMWRAGLRIQEALALAEGDLDHRRGSVLVRRGKGGRRREVGMDAWGWEQLEPWLDVRRGLPIGLLLCLINGATRGRHQLRPAPTAAHGRRSRGAAPHQSRYAHAVEMAREGVPLIVIQRQLGHSNLGITSVLLQVIDSGGTIETVHGPTRPQDARQRVAVALIDSRARTLLVAHCSTRLRLRRGAPRRWLTRD